MPDYERLAELAGTYWREPRAEIDRATNLRRQELAAMERETRDVLALSGVLGNDGNE